VFAHRKDNNIMANLSDEGKAISRQVEEAGYSVLDQDLTEILFNPEYRGTPEREALLAELREYFGDDEEEEDEE
jgi:hypothetical protein